jgi:cytochrome c-type biogenesis protein
MIADVTHSLAAWWAPALAFLAGAISFASPCVFPLVPGYVSFVTGGTAIVGTDQEHVRAPLTPIVLFILGFSTVFILLFASSATVVRIVTGDVAQRIGGGFVILMGLLMIAYALRIGPIALYAERRPLLTRVRPGVWGAFPLGLAFGAGWTPCIGPVLTGIIAIAATQSTPRGVFLLAMYSLGLGLPFLLVGIGVQQVLGAFVWVKRNYRWFAVVSGTLMVTMGVLLATGLLTRWFAPLQRYTPFGI